MVLKVDTYMLKASIKHRKTQHYKKTEVKTPVLIIVCI